MATVELLHSPDGIPLVRCSIADLAELARRDLTPAELSLFTHLEAEETRLDMGRDLSGMALIMERGSFAVLCLTLRGRDA